RGRRRLVEGNGDPAPRPARDDPRGRVLGHLAALYDAHQGAGTDLRAARVAPWRGREADQRPPGQTLLVDGLQIDRGHAARGALAERQPGRGLGEALPLRLSLGVEK